MAKIFKSSGAKQALVLLALCSAGIAEVFENDMGYLECNMTSTECMFEFDVQAQTSMTYQGQFVSVNNEGNLVYINGANGEQKVPHNETLMTLDGYYRLVLAVNGKIPGPHIVVYENQTVNILVRNKLISNTVTVHWHGIDQVGTPWMDGVGWINQCPIGAGQFYRYVFKVPVPGTYWYHSHIAVQRTNGIFGGLIVKKRPTTDDVPIDIIMTVGEWQHEMADELFNQGYTSTGGNPYVYFSGLIEGKGRYWKQGYGQNLTTVKAPLKHFKVTKNKSYRFRVIHVGSYQPFRVSIDSHKLEVVATDAYDIEPMTVDSFIINSGERYDFVLKANQTSRNYLINLDAVSFHEHTLLPNPKKSVPAVLQYDKANNTEPNSIRTDNCTKTNPCKVINCQYPNYPAEEHIKCVNMKIKNATQHPVPHYKKEDVNSVEYHFNFGFRFGKAHWNGRSFITPGVNALTQTDQLGIYKCGDLPKGIDKPYQCFQQIDIPDKVTTVQIVLSSLRKGSGSHPIHLHGHSFHVLKVGFGDKNGTEDNKDIACNDDYCTSPKWSNSDWGGDNISGLNLANPAIKDTVYVPKHGYVVIRFKAGNAGKWIMHCHIEAHLALGMAVVFSEWMNKMSTPPQGLPICSDFYNDPKKDFKITNNPPDDNNDDKVSHILASTLGGLAIIQLIIIVVVVLKYRSLKKRKSNTRTSSIGMHMTNTNIIAT